MSMRSTNIRWWFIVLPLLLITIIAQIDKVSISMIISNQQFLQDLNLAGKPAVIGLLMSGFLISYSLGHFFWGYIIKKLGPRWAAVIGVVIWSVCMFLSGMAGTAGSLIFARVLLGIGEAFLFPVGNTFIANWFPLKERGRANSIWLNGMLLGPVVSGALVVTILAAGNWQTVFYFLGFLSLVPLPLLFFFMRDKPDQHRWVNKQEAEYITSGSLLESADVPKDEASAAGIGTVLRNHRFWLVTLAWGFNNIFYWGWVTWMPTYFQNARNFSFQTAGYLYSTAYLFQLLAILLVGYLSDRFMRRAPFGAVGWLAAGVLMFIGGNIIENSYTALAVLIIGICFQAPAFMISQTLLQSIVPENVIGPAAGISGGVSQLMAVVSPTLVGILLGISGFPLVIFFLSLMSFIAGVLICFLIKEGY